METRERWSIRKLSIGAASVLVATSVYLGKSTTQVVKAADGADPSSPQQAEASGVVKAETKPEDLQLVDSTTQGSTTTSKVSDQTPAALTTWQTDKGSIGLGTTTLANAKDKAEQAGATVKEGAAVNYGTDYAKAAADYDAQIEALVKAQSALVNYQNDSAAYKQKLDQYEQALKQYEEALKEYNKQKADYDAYLASIKDQDTAGAVEIAQKLNYESEPDATVAVSGNNVQYVTPDAVSRLGQEGLLEQFAPSTLQGSDLVSTSPYANTQDQWVKMSVGDTISVTYDNLSGKSTFIDNDGKTYTFSKVVYNYTLNSSTNNEGSALARIMRDPTQTAYFGADTDDQSKALNVSLELQFYDQNGQLIDLSKGTAVVSLSSLNHWDGALYLPAKPKPVTVEATNSKGEKVQATWNPYEGDAQVEQGQGNTAQSSIELAKLFAGQDVDLSTVKVVDLPQLSTYQNDPVYTDNSHNAEKLAKQVKGINLQASTDTAYVAADSTGADTNPADIIGHYADNDGQIVGVYNVTNSALVYTPAFKYDNSQHIEKVGLNGNQFVQIPGSSVTHDPATDEAYSVNSNQYIAQGALFNGPNINGIEGWDNENDAQGNPSAKKYYGSAAMLVKNSGKVKLDFTVSGNEPGTNTVYWFTVNSTLALPKDPGNPPEAPVKPTAPTDVANKEVEVHDIYVEQTVPDVPVTPTPGNPGDNTPGEPGDNTPDEPGNNQPGKPNKPGHDNPSQPGNNNPGQDNGEKPGNGQFVQVATRVARHTLPQTGESQTGLVALLGAMLTFAAATLGFKNKRKEN